MEKFRLISCIIVMEERVSLTMVTVETRKTHLSNYHRNGYLKDKCFIKNMNLIDKYNH